MVEKEKLAQGVGKFQIPTDCLLVFIVPIHTRANLLHGFFEPVYGFQPCWKIFVYPTYHHKHFIVYFCYNFCGSYIFFTAGKVQS